MNTALIQNTNATRADWDTAWSVRVGQGIILAGLVCIFAWGFGANPGDADFGLRTVSDAIPLPDITIPATATSVVLGLIVVALGAWHAVRGFSRPRMRWVTAAVLVCFVVGPPMIEWLRSVKLGQKIRAEEDCAKAARMDSESCVASSLLWCRCQQKRSPVSG
jgi:hypothetical protein